MMLNGAVYPECVNANVNVNIDLKAEGWQTVGIVISVCASVVTICYFNRK